MSYNNFLSSEQIQLINMYNTQYNRTLTQVDRLLDTLDNIRDHIQQITEQGNSRNQFVRRNHRINSRNRNMFFSSNLNDDTNVFSIFNERPRTVNPTFVDYLNTTVRIRPTNEQIQNATREITYGDITDPPNETCPISLDRFDPDDSVSQIIHCGHIFCQAELQEWFQNNVRCPVCRYDIRDYTTRGETSSQTRGETSSQTRGETSSQPRGETTSQPNATPNSNETISHISNLSFVRNPTTNQTEQIVFDFEVDNQLNNMTSQIIQSLLSQNRNRR